jgi:hypothetical protein
LVSEVTKKERDIAKRIYEHEEEKAQETVAFGRRSEGPPSLYYLGTPTRRPITRASSKFLFLMQHIL